MLKHAASLLVAGALLAPLSARADEKGPKPGMWETTVTTKIEGMPMKPQPHTSSRCVTAKEAEDRQKWLPPNDEHQKGCKVVDFKHTGKKVTWKISCESAQGEGELNLGETSYEGTMKMTADRPPGAPGGGGKMKILVDIKGKRTGDC